MHVHILGICGTFMAGIAALAKASGHRVTGSDQGVYPPMSDQLAALGIEVSQGYDPAQLEPQPDVVVVGNVMTRGMPLVESLLSSRIPYTSGPAWLADQVLEGRTVASVAGTHGKTTTSSLLAWILDHAGHEPGFLIGGVPGNFDSSARLGEGDVFVIEADEYDTAFFDKRSKFLHYPANVQIIGNLEFDHADIFADLEAIQWQFHQLLRRLPGDAHLVTPAANGAIEELLEMGCWTPIETFSSDADVVADWHVGARPDGTIRLAGATQEYIGGWTLNGAHNAENAAAALLAARHLGVEFEQGIEALATFAGVKRRLELRARPRGIEIYDDFAHHPTAIRRTIEGLRGDGRPGRLLVVLEPRSNTMRMGIHRDALAAAMEGADLAWVFGAADAEWDIVGAFSASDHVRVRSDTEAIVDELKQAARTDDRIVIMSNGGFEGIHARIEAALSGP